MRSSPCTIDLEGKFGPQVDNACLDGFDFTLLFEESILSVSISALLLSAVPLRIAYLMRQPQKAVGGVLHLAKLVRVSYSCLTIVLIGAIPSLHGPR